MPKISIIVPIYNVEKYLERCIQSLLNQTLRDIEIIMVDDESPDDCPQLCDIYASQDQRIKVIHKKNEGLGYARNTGLEIASGEYIAFVDSDDYVDINMYEKLYQIAQKNNLDTVFSNFNTVDQHQNIHKVLQQKEFHIYKNEDIKNDLLLNMIASDVNIKKERSIDMSVWRAIYSREIITSHQIKFESERVFMSEDIIFHIDYLSHAKAVGLVPQAYYYYAVNPESLTKKIRTDRFEKSKVLHTEIIKRGLKYKLPSSFKQRADRFFIGYARSNIKNLCKSSLPLSTKRTIILNICKDNYWNRIYNHYPINKMPFQHKFFLLSIKFHFFALLYLLSKLK